jgi:hypothetical protein
LRRLVNVQVAGSGGGEVEREVEGFGTSLVAELVSEGRWSSDGKLRSWSTTCEPRKPQPPTTRTVPRDIVREVILISWGV